MRNSSVIKTLVTRILIRGLSADIDIGLWDVTLVVTFPDTQPAVAKVLYDHHFIVGFNSQLIFCLSCMWERGREGERGGREGERGGREGERGGGEGKEREGRGGEINNGRKMGGDEDRGMMAFQLRM